MFVVETGRKGRLKAGGPDSQAQTAANDDPGGPGCQAQTAANDDPGGPGCQAQTAAAGDPGGFRQSRQSSRLESIIPGQDRRPLTDTPHAFIQQPFELIQLEPVGRKFHFVFQDHLLD